MERAGGGRETHIGTYIPPSIAQPAATSARPPRSPGAYHGRGCRCWPGTAIPIDAVSLGCRINPLARHLQPNSSFDKNSACRLATSASPARQSVTIDRRLPPVGGDVWPPLPLPLPLPLPPIADQISHAQTPPSWCAWCVGEEPTPNSSQAEPDKKHLLDSPDHCCCATLARAFRVGVAWACLIAAAAGKSVLGGGGGGG